MKLPGVSGDNMVKALDLVLMERTDWDARMANTGQLPGDRGSRSQSSIFHGLLNIIFKGLWYNEITLDLHSSN